MCRLPERRAPEKRRRVRLWKTRVCAHYRATAGYVKLKDAVVWSNLLSECGQDALHTLRLWVRRPWHVIFAIAVLAIGIGANTGVFSVVNALLLRSLPFRDADRLVYLRNFLPPDNSAAQFHEWRRQSAYLSDAAAFEENDINLGAGRTAARAHVAQASWNFFSLLGVEPVLGRGFARDEDMPGRNSVAVIGYGLWQELFAGDRRALGSTVRIDGKPLTVIGVAPPGFDYPHGAVLWKPASFSPGNNGWETIARLKPGFTRAQARGPFQADFDRLTRTSLYRPVPVIIPLRDEVAGPAKTASLALMAGVVLILLIACANLANLLMARVADRAAELAIRSALGASRARLVRQLLTECLLLSIAGAAAGLPVALWTTSLAARVQPAPLAVLSYSLIDARVLGFALAASIVTGVLFGVMPGLNAGRTIAAARAGSPHARETLVAVQVALTIVLLSSAFSVGRAFTQMTRTARGFDARGLVTVNVSLEGTAQQFAHRNLAWFEQALARVRDLPGVRAASATEFLPIYATAYVGGPFGADGRPAKEPSLLVPVLSDYFRTMGGRIVAGREFTDAEVRSNAYVVVVNERFARQLGGAADAIGHHVTDITDTPMRIIGVVQAMDYMTEAAAAEPSQVFVPAGEPGSFFSTIVVRVDGRAEDHLAAVRDALRSLDPQVPVFGAKTMQQRLEDALARPRFYSTAARFFAAFALLLAAVGIYGVVSWAVGRRMREMGIRMAVGRTPARLRATVLAQGLRTVGIGAAVGIVVAVASGRLLDRLISSAGAPDAETFACSVCLIAVVASLAVWSATRRIATLDIMAVLRSE